MTVLVTRRTCAGIVAARSAEFRHPGRALLPVQVLTRGCPGRRRAGAGLASG
ncbi:MAG TPA: hypothetical protein VGP03_06155 [Pseudonocardiaceae bacterium]|nr:hypothetical protein [Pseudonocardiaceae bacterium]